jgi:hypothetical protein
MDTGQYEECDDETETRAFSSKESSQTIISNSMQSIFRAICSLYITQAAKLNVQ